MHLSASGTSAHYGDTAAIAHRHRAPVAAGGMCSRGGSDVETGRYLAHLSLPVSTSQSVPGDAGVGVGGARGGEWGTARGENFKTENYKTWGVGQGGAKIVACAGEQGAARSRFWSDEEHSRFLQAIKIFGYGNAQDIAAYVSAPCLNLDSSEPSLRKCLSICLSVYHHAHDDTSTRTLPPVFDVLCVCVSACAHETDAGSVGLTYMLSSL